MGSPSLTGSRFVFNTRQALQVTSSHCETHSHALSVHSNNSMMFQCWASFTDAGPTLKQH